jgi:two-component system, chemotaxis family, sensor kinase CheA
VRNAVDHGIEDSYERLAKGKPREGNIRLTLSHADGHFVIDVADDGSGIDFAKVRRKAVEKKLLDGNVEIADRDLVSVLFLPGFSSRDEVTEISGRGVGLDVVKESVAALGGKIAVSVQKDKGTRISLRVPG